jgi:hypothetical protein
MRAGAAGSGAHGGVDSVRAADGGDEELDAEVAGKLDAAAAGAFAAVRGVLERCLLLTGVCSV